MNFKQRWKLWMVLFFVVGVTPLTTIVAIAAGPELPSPEFIARNAEGFMYFMSIVISALCAMIGYFVYTGNKNNERQWDAINSLDRRLSHLEGEHKVNHGGRRDYDPVFFRK